MTLDSILIRFLVLITILFFLPKLIHRFYKVPFPLTEIALGAALAIFLPEYFFIDDMVSIFATVGIISLFVYAGIEVEPDFIRKNRRFFIENSVRHILVFGIIAFGAARLLGLGAIEAMIISIALTTPSASYILSSGGLNSKSTKTWVASKAISGEVLALVMLVVLLKASSLIMLALTLAVLGVLIFALPHLFKGLYTLIMGKANGLEFSLIFVIALLSAFVTESMGIHFLIGAFIAGFVARRFIAELVKEKKYRHFTRDKGHATLESFGFFAATFIPFYFFSIGLRIEKEMFTLDNILLSFGLFFAVAFIILASFSIHRMWRIKESFSKSIEVSSYILPTLVFTFVIATILKREYAISEELFSILTFYGIITAVAGLVLPRLFSRKQKAKHL